MQSLFRFALVVVPTAILATAVVVGVSRNGESAAVIADGDLERDLKLASSTSLELAPAGQPLATVSAVEARPIKAPERTLRPKGRTGSSRAVRSRARVVRAAPEPEIADDVEESETAEVTTLATGEAEGAAEGPAGGVALPRPTAIPVIIPTAGGGYDPGPGTVIRGGGGVFGDDPCRIHGRGGAIYGPPIYREPRGGTIADARERIRSRTPDSGGDRRPTIRDRVRASSDGGSSGARRPTINDRVRRGG